MQALHRSLVMATALTLIFVVGVMAIFVIVRSQNISTSTPEDVIRTTIRNATNNENEIRNGSGSTISTSEQQNRIPLYLGGLFSLGGRADESGHVPAVEMGLDHVNQRTDILSGYDLRMVWNDTKVSLFLRINSGKNGKYSPQVHNLSFKKKKKERKKKSHLALGLSVKKKKKKKKKKNPNQTNKQTTQQTNKQTYNCD